MLSRIQLRNLLSFGPNGIDLELRPLNVLIGPNASGKSNLIEAISLLQAMPGDLADRIRAGGGIMDWLWRGAERPTAWIEAVVDNAQGHRWLRHVLKFTEIGQRFEIVDEWVGNAAPRNKTDRPYFNYQLNDGQPTLLAGDKRQRLSREEVSFSQSILAQRGKPNQYSEMAFLARQYSNVRLYGDWTFGHASPARIPRKTDERNDHLLPDSRNLALMVNKLQANPGLKRRIAEFLGKFIDGATGVGVHIEGGTAQLYLEEGSFSVPATRLSDGTLQFISLLVVLLDPVPPPLICIDEPELGLHTDALVVIGELLIEASKRTQLIVTTHSDVLLDAMSEQPDSVVVCQRDRGETQMRRLDPKRLSRRLEEQTLGELWSSGEIGGNRW